MSLNDPIAGPARPATEIDGEQGLARLEATPRLDYAFVQDPHDLYRRLRTEAPAHRVVMWGGVNAWLVTRYAEAKAILADPRLSKDWRGLVRWLPSGADPAYRTALNAHMLHKDPPDHTRLRKLVTRAFTAGAVEKLRAGIVKITDELLGNIAVAAASGGTVDLMQSYAVPVPIRVIGELLGVPSHQRETFRKRVDPILTSTDPGEVYVAECGLADLLQAVIAQKRMRPTADLLSALVHTADVDDRLTDDELLSTAYLLIVAGYETTVNLIGNGVLALLRHPAQLAALRANLSLLPRAVDEFLRFESPLNIATLRFTTKPIRIGQVEIPAGQPVLVALLAANRDSRQYVNPDRLDITRTPNSHLAFGHGIHRCLGAPLARLEGEIAIGQLLTRFDETTLGDDAVLRYRTSTLMRGLSALPVRLRMASTNDSA